LTKRSRAKVMCSRGHLNFFPPLFSEDLLKTNREKGVNGDETTAENGFKKAKLLQSKPKHNTVQVVPQTPFPLWYHSGSSPEIHSSSMT
jgi:hypothetical protein